MSGGFDKKTAALCDVDECEQLARYVETGDGHAVRDPEKRCEEHHSNHGLWRDLAWSIAREFHLEDDR